MEEETKQNKRLGYGYMLTNSGLKKVNDAFEQRGLGKSALLTKAEAIDVQKDTLRRLLMAGDEERRVSLSSIQRLFSNLELSLSEADYENAPIKESDENVSSKREDKTQDEKNPFIYSKPLKPVAVYGRHTEVRKLLESCAQSWSRQLFGVRHIGKSSLLELAYSESKPLIGKFCLLDGRRASIHSPQGFYGEVAHNLASSSGSEQAKPLEADVASAGDTLTYTSFELILEDLKKKSNGETPVVFFDNFDFFHDDGKGNDRLDDFFWNNLRSLIDRELLTLIVATRSNLKEVLNRPKQQEEYKMPLDTSYFFSDLGYFKVPSFQPETAAEFVRTWPDNKSRFTKAYQDKIIKKSAEYNNHPMALQILCYHAFEYKSDEANWDEALEEAEEEIKDKGIAKSND